MSICSGRWTKLKKTRTPCTAMRTRRDFAPVNMKLWTWRIGVGNELPEHNSKSNGNGTKKRTNTGRKAQALCRSDSLYSCSETTLTNERSFPTRRSSDLRGETPSQTQLGRRSRTRISHQQ